jgi:glutathione S-transferase
MMSPQPAKCGNGPASRPAAASRRNKIAKTRPAFRPIISGIGMLNMAARAGGHAAAIAAVTSGTATMWPVARRLMTRMYDIKPGAAAESRARLEAELDWLDAKLADGRAYFAGDRFSRADLTVASLLANFARPKELSVHHSMKGPDALAADVNRWSSRPVMRWVVDQYQAHRAPFHRR